MPSQASRAVAPASVYGVAHSTVTASEPLAVITGGGFDTKMVAEAVLFGAGFGSAVEEVTEAEAVMPVPSCVEQSFSPTVSASCADAPAASVAAVQVTWPLAPTAGVEQVQPDGAVMAWNPVCAGIAMVIDTLAAGRSSSVGSYGCWLVSALLVTVMA